MLGVQKGIKEDEEDNEHFRNEFSETDEDVTIFDTIDEADVEKTEAELQSIIDGSKRSLQEMKEDALNSVRVLSHFSSNIVVERMLISI